MPHPEVEVFSRGGGGVGGMVGGGWLDPNIHEDMQILEDSGSGVHGLKRSLTFSRRMTEPSASVPTGPPFELSVGVDA